MNDTLPGDFQGYTFEDLIVVKTEDSDSAGTYDDDLVSDYADFFDGLEFAKNTQIFSGYKELGSDESEVYYDDDEYFLNDDRDTTTFGDDDPQEHNRSVCDIELQIPEFHHKGKQYIFQENPLSISIEFDPKGTHRDAIKHTLIATIDDRDVFEYKGPKDEFDVERFVEKLAGYSEDREGGTHKVGDLVVDAVEEIGGKIS